MTKQPNSAPENQPPLPRLQWGYPFPNAARKEIVDPQTFYEAFGAMDDGFFPLGVNGFPHGGVHFGKGTATRLFQEDGVRCIADGEIVAYRIDDAYPHLFFKQSQRWAMYSTGFVLVRHHLALPPAPGTKPTSQPEDETLEFYSLYMHMADWNTYLADGQLKRPGWWLGVEAYRIQGADNQIGGGAAGAFVRTAPSTGKSHGRAAPGEAVGFLPAGSEVIIGERRGEWGHIKEISAGGMISPTSGGDFGTDDMNVPWERPDSDSGSHAPVTERGDWGWIRLHDHRPITEPTSLGSVIIPPEPIAIKAGTLLGQLGEYHDYGRSTPLPPKSVRQLMHLEVFAGDAFRAFLDKSRARAAQLPAAERRAILVLRAGAKLVSQATTPYTTFSQIASTSLVEISADSPKFGPWVKVRVLQHSNGTKDNSATTVWIERRYVQGSSGAIPAWKDFPLQLGKTADPANGEDVVYSRVQLDAMDSAFRTIDDKGIRWWCVEIGTANGERASGWVCEKDHPGTQWESPWAWPGFTVVDATGINLADAFKRTLSVSGAASPPEQQQFEPSVQAVGGSPLLLKLEKTVGRLVSGDKNGSTNAPSSGVTAGKLQLAMRDRWLASELAHVILKYESEWGGNISRWEALTPLMKNAQENWKCELDRIKKLQWWNEVHAKLARFPSSAVVYHLHPIALLGNFLGDCPEACKTEVFEFETTEGTFRVSRRAFDFILEKEGYGSQPYVPGNDQSSGVTIGYGYDLGQQKPQVVANDLAGLLKPEFIKRLQTACGAHGDAARKLLSSFSDISMSRDDALKLAVIMKRRCAQWTVDAFPGVTSLHPHCQGALLDLVYNRGPGMEDRPGQKSRAHMRAIRADIAANNTTDVPTQLRKMKSLWEGQGQSGLVTRREEEAVLFESGISCNCWK